LSEGIWGSKSNGTYFPGPLSNLPALILAVFNLIWLIGFSCLLFKNYLHKTDPTEIFFAWNVIFKFFSSILTIIIFCFICMQIHDIVTVPLYGQTLPATCPASFKSLPAGLKALLINNIVSLLFSLYSLHGAFVVFWTIITRGFVGLFDAEMDSTHKSPLSSLEMATENAAQTKV